MVLTHLTYHIVNIISGSCKFLSESINFCFQSRVTKLIFFLSCAGPCTISFKRKENNKFDLAIIYFNILLAIIILNASPGKLAICMLIKVGKSKESIFSHTINFTELYICFFIPQAERKSM